MSKPSWLVGRRSTPTAVALGAVATGVVLLAARVEVGTFVVLGGLAILSVFDRRVFVMALAASAPLATLGWTLPLGVLGERTLDVRTALSFGVAAIASVAVLRQWTKPTSTELIFLGLVVTAAVSGVFKADSIVVWAPQVARLLSYLAILYLARRQLDQTGDLRLLMSVICLGFLVPTLLGLAQFVAGESSFLNGAVRATAPGGRGPIALAFDGQMVLVLAYALALTTPTMVLRRLWLAVAVVGGLGLYASATRLVTATTWLILALWEGLRQKWRNVLVITLVVAMSALARPDLLARFLSAVEPGIESGSCDTGEDLGDCWELDASLRFRVFVWSTVLRAWEEEPVIGIGPGMTAVLVSREAAVESTAPHNDYVGFLAETGFLGLSLYLALQGSVIFGLVRTRRRSSETTKALVTLVGITFLAIDVLAFLDNPIYFVDVQLPLWALVGAAGQTMAGGASSDGNTAGPLDLSGLPHVQPEGAP